jgi:hypothetical protein
MNVALENRSVYDNFVLEKDILYFRVGDHGMVSFHGKNFNVKKRMPTEQFTKLIADASFFKVNTDCYVNIKKVETIHEGKVCFHSQSSDSKHVMITKLRQSRLKEFLNQRKQEQIEDTFI